MQRAGGKKCLIYIFWEICEQVKQSERKIYQSNNNTYIRALQLPVLFFSHLFAAVL